MSASNFEKIMFFVGLGTKADEKIEIGQLEKTGSSVEIGRLAKHIESDYETYFAPRGKDQPSIAAQYLLEYKTTKSSETRTKLKGYLAQAYGFLHDKEEWSKYSLRNIESQLKQFLEAQKPEKRREIEEAMAKYERNPESKKARFKLEKSVGRGGREVADFVYNRTNLRRELRRINIYKGEFRKTIDCSNYIM